MTNMNGHAKKIIITMCFSIVPVWEAVSEDLSAKVIMMRGAVKAKLQDGRIIDVQVNQAIPEGSLVQTADKSFVKIILADKSQINLGPNSQMTISALPKTQAGIITLVKGQIRSQVSKDYMQIEDKSKSKLYIKTKTAAMGVRGTDFQVNYNSENKNTVLITFEGKVAISNIDLENDMKLNQDQLENIVSNEKAVLVTEGKISAINFNISPRAMLPTKLNPTQIEVLEKNDNNVENTKDEKSDSMQNSIEKSDDKLTAKYRSPIPPGVDGSTFSNEYRDAVAARKFENGTDKESNEDPRGYFNKKTGEYKLPSGSLVDLKTLNIIPPPINAIYDTNTQTFLIPENLGKVDPTSGEYVPPTGLILDSSGKFVPVEPIAPVNEPTSTDERTPSSTETTPLLSPPPPTSIYDGSSELKEFQEIYSAPIATDPMQSTTNTIDPNLSKLATETQLKNEQDLLNSTNTGSVAPTSQVKFILKTE